ncbi:hypothetical protein [Streptomyces sp. NPDC048516]|uniref:hypothetical protein n=1 Tax=Streptomyces sp. NPDC048516 TaxID=3365565 RepID=UPI003711EB34
MLRAPERTTRTVLARQPAPCFRAAGLPEADPRLLRGVPMPTDTTGAPQRNRLLNARLTVWDLPRLRDVGADADTQAGAAAAPHIRFAAMLHRIAKVPVR